MKGIVQCSNCSKCAIQQPAGFIARMIYRCSVRGYRSVSEDDGCTMGAKGDPKVYAREEKTPCWHIARRWHKYGTK